MLCVNALLVKNLKNKLILKLSEIEKNYPEMSDRYIEIEV